MLSAGHPEPIASGNTPENADHLPSNINHRRKCRRASRLRHEPRTVRGNQKGLAPQKNRRSGWEIALGFIVHHGDAIATLLVGLWATHVGWRRERITPPGMEALGRPERWIGPLLVAFAVLEFVVPP